MPVGVRRNVAVEREATRKIPEAYNQTYAEDIFRSGDKVIRQNNKHPYAKS